MSLQQVELHYGSSPSLAARASAHRVAERADALLGSGISVTTGADGALVFHHGRHIRQYVSGPVTARTAVREIDKTANASVYAAIADQSWSCRDAAERIDASTHVRLLTESIAAPFDPDLRLALFHGVLQALVELTQPDVIVFLHSEQAVAASDYLATCEHPPIERLGAINTRFFTVENSASDMIMDTRGLEEIGLHDLQCHFRDLDPDDVSRVLYSTALYVFEHGPVIESGETITGTEPGSMWQCQFEESLLAPRRTVLDLNAGPGHAAGERETTATHDKR